MGKVLKSPSLSFLTPEMVKNKDIASLTQRTHVKRPTKAVIRVVFIAKNKIVCFLEKFK